MAPIVGMLANSGASCAMGRYFLALLLTRQKQSFIFLYPLGNVRMEIAAWK
jgi:hypothetical protein